MQPSIVSVYDSALMRRPLDCHRSFRRYRPSKTYSMGNGITALPAEKVLSDGSETNHPQIHQIIGFISGLRLSVSILTSCSGAHRRARSHQLIIIEDSADCDRIRKGHSCGARELDPEGLIGLINCITTERHR